MPLALFGISNDGLNLAVNLLVLFLVVVWLALIAWTYLDARRRIADPVLVGCATAASLFPFVGSVVYSILRPPEFLADARERELEIRAAQLRVRQLEQASCPNCEFPLEGTYLRCPRCRARVKNPCDSCGKPIDPRWRICPYCETPVQRAAPPARPAQDAEGQRPSRSSRAPRAGRSVQRPERAERPERERAERPGRSSRSPSTGSKPRPAPRKSGTRSTSRETPGDRPATAP